MLNSVISSQANKSETNKPNTRFIIGNRHFISNTTTLVSNGYWYGDIQEVLIFDTVLTDEERMKINHYLAKKWGLTASVDSDGDSFTDASEASAGTDPIDPTSAPELLTIMRNSQEVTFTSSDQYTMADGSEIYVFKYISNDGNNKSQYDLNINMLGTMDILMVGGGGGYGRGGGGGGAGGLVFYPALDLSTLNTVTLKVGNGGASSGNNGADSEIIFNSQTITAKGGGGSGRNTNGNSGGSGGGIKHYPILSGGATTQSTGVTDVWVGYGNNGGNHSGDDMSSSGGAGAGATGGEAGYRNDVARYNNAARGIGGIGKKDAEVGSTTYDFKTLFWTTAMNVGELDGSNLYFAGGGGGGDDYNRSNGRPGGKGGGGHGGENGQSYTVNGSAHTGGGGGGGYFENSNSKGQGNGGSGVIIIRITETP
jgi:hypothetical protein